MSRSAAAVPAPEFSRPVRVNDLPPNGDKLQAKAGAEERAALARRFGVKKVERFGFRGEVRPEADGWRVEGEVRARVVQPCVVTLEDVAQELAEPFSRLYLPGAPEPDLADIDPSEDDDPPEPLGHRIDPGEVAAEIAALAIDPYPRAPGATFAAPAVGPDGAEEEDGAARPFAALAALRERLDKDDG
ncbi:Uncharacterized metal-binding protein YceD, DUF177 family [Albimonas donghaensis]|uniref:Uncharacterized metal-binding protein YceD, DUF177 family n=1 Tax=Albimonas donghaensis TaxID=356660 RepID=A0A1H3A7I6_9RHOB|nr:DUF177 domain-containing protein [Albimonas donghaensis]SDX24839.1 Uncharacterized metal-binding protein YceD, DUF177 family [Albimonas donghaensis]